MEDRQTAGAALGRTGVDVQERRLPVKEPSLERSGESAGIQSAVPTRNSRPFISLENLNLQFRVRRQRRLPLKDFALRWVTGRYSNPVKVLDALKDINLEISDGNRVGIIGHNGAGKSTLLRMIAGIYPATGGRRTVQGTIASLFDLAAGFEGEASGWDNIAYRGYLQGETPQTIRDKAESIAEFSELGEFLDTPVKYYSSGMKVRLAFSIATAIDPEILLIDEVLGAGDAPFQKKARERIKQLISRASLLVMVSHNLETLSEVCNRIVWMERGRVRRDGPADEVLEEYRRAVGQERQVQPSHENSKLKIAS